jgi:hypothetical protein
MPTAPRIFISHLAKDTLFAQQLYQQLADEGFSLSPHPTAMPADDVRQDQLEAAIDACDTLILCMSRDALASSVITQAWLYARRQGKRVTPVLTQPIETDKLPRWMARVDWMETGLAGFLGGDAPESSSAWARLVNHLNTPEERPKVTYDHPPLPDDFVMRPQELEPLIDAVLNPSHYIASITEQQGAGGYGKTTLALAVCHDERVRLSFDAILWVTLGEKLTENDVDGLQKDLVKTLTPKDLLYDLKRAVGDQHVLFVVDDAWAAYAVGKFFGFSDNIFTLVTTPHPRILGRREYQQQIDGMTPTEAVQLLGAGFYPPHMGSDSKPTVSTTMANTEEPLLEQLAERLGWWPWALRWVNRVLHERYALLADLGTAMTYVHDQLDRQGFTALVNPSDPNECHAAIDAVIGLSLSLLPDQQVTQFVQLAIFPKHTDIALPTLSKLWGLDADETDRLCTDLSSQLLVLRHDVEKKTIRLHGMVYEHLHRHHQANLEAWHTKMIKAWQDLYALPDEYAWRNLAYHLIQSGQDDRLYALLTDYRWLQAKLDATDSGALEADCTALLRIGKYPDYCRITEDRQEVIRLIRSVMMLSHNFLRDKSKLPYFLVGRLWTHRQHPDLDNLWRTCHSITPLELLETQEYPPMRQASKALDKQLRRHTNDVRGVLLMPDGRFVSWSSTNNLRLWSLDGQMLEGLFGHTSLINGALLMPDGNILSWSRDTTLRLWSPDGHPLATLTGHTKSVSGAHITSDGRILSWSRDNTLRLWSPDGEPLVTLTGHTDWVKGALVMLDGRILSWAEDKTLRLWSSDGLALAELRGFTSVVNGMLLMPDGRILSWSNEKILRLWSSDGLALAELRGHTKMVNGALLMPDGRILSWSNDQTLRLWSSDGLALAELRGHTKMVNGALLMPDGRILSWSDDQTLRLWSSDGHPLAVLSGHVKPIRTVFLMPDGRIKSWSYHFDDPILWSSDGERIFYRGNDLPPVFLPDAQSIKSLSGLQGNLILLDGRILSWSSGRHILLQFVDERSSHLSFRDREMYRYYSQESSLLTLKNKRILSWSQDKTLTLWSPNGQLLATLTGHTREVTGAVQLADGRVLSWSDDHTLRLWSPDGHPLAELSGHTSRVIGVSQLADGRLLSWTDGGYSQDHTLRLWSSDGQPLATLIGHTGSVKRVRQLADGRILSWSPDHTLRLWSADGHPLATLTGHTSWVEGALQLADGRLLSWSGDKTLKLWSTDGQPLATLTGHTGSVKRVLQLADGRLLSWADGSYYKDHTVRMWTTDGQLLAALGHTNSVKSVWQLADGRLLSWSWDTLRLWSPDGESIAHLDNWESQQARFEGWAEAHGVDVRVLYKHDPNTPESPYALGVDNRLWVYGVGEFIGDAGFTRVAVSGQTITVGDEDRRVIFLRVRGGG